MLVRSATFLPLLLVIGAFLATQAHAGQSPTTDWGGGYIRGPDSASVTVATSGAGAPKLAPAAAPPAPAPGPDTDWGGGYLRGADSASTTLATAGAAKPKLR